LPLTFLALDASKSELSFLVINPPISIHDDQTVHSLSKDLPAGHVPRDPLLNCIDG
jgi:hypothetical protein